MTHASASPLPPAILMDVIDNRRFGAQYQPLMDVRTGAIAAYEALARFETAAGVSLPPTPVFQALHDSPISLFQVEWQLKRLQVDHAPEGAALFLNVDQDAFAVHGDSDDNPLLSLFQERDDLVVEIIENSSINDARISQSMAQAFRRRRVGIALDDIGAPDTLLAVEVLADVDYLKFAADWLRRLDAPHCLSLFRHLLAFARECDKTTVLEGVETQADLHLARDAGIDLVQGFLFKDAFVSIPPTRSAAPARAA